MKSNIFYIKIFSLDGGVERHSVNTFSVSHSSLLVFRLRYRSVYSFSLHCPKVDFFLRLVYISTYKHSDSGRILP